jgi:hypothetical protein
MAIKTFTTGEVLTAADTNTYLANSGLVYIKSQTIGSSVGSVTVTGAFSSTFDNYLIQVSGGSNSINSVLSLRMDSVTSGYYFNFIYTGWSSGIAADGGTNASSWIYQGSGTTSGLSMSVTVLSPNLAKTTRCSSVGTGEGTGYNGFASGVLFNTSQYTDFTILPTGGTMTGGTITVYGYRKA